MLLQILKVTTELINVIILLVCTVTQVNITPMGLKPLKSKILFFKINTYLAIHPHNN